MNIDLNKFTKEELLSMLNYVLDHAKEQRLEIEKLHSIIKEAKEYIELGINFDSIGVARTKRALLEMLDVEGK